LHVLAERSATQSGNGAFRGADRFALVVRRVGRLEPETAPAPPREGKLGRFVGIARLNDFSDSAEFAFHETE
jgi:hypothetical protein